MTYCYGDLLMDGHYYRVVKKKPEVIKPCSCVSNYKNNKNSISHLKKEAKIK